MRCAWQELLAVLPPWLREHTDKHGKDKLLELRLRLGKPPELVGCGSAAVFREVTQEDLSFVINAASRYSPWAAETVAKGYLTAQGGHRIGICGEAVTEQGCLKGIRSPRSLCIRVARDFPGIARGIPMAGSVLILGPPGAGKTTLLRDLIRQRSEYGNGSIAVVDERGELFPKGFPCGPRTDILSGASKVDGIPLVLRTMGPGTIAVDEITAAGDTEALCLALWCGVDILATAHASSAEDLRRRPGYRKLLESNMFQTIVTIRPDKSWRTERICV